MKPGIESQRIFERPPLVFYVLQLLGASLFILLVLFVMDQRQSVKSFGRLVQALLLPVHMLFLCIHTA